MMKKVLPIILAVVMIFAFSACKSKPDDNTFYLNITNNTDSQILGYDLFYAIGGKPLGSGALVNAKEKYMAKGETITQSFNSKDFPDGADISSFTVNCSVLLADNEKKDIKAPIKISAKYGGEYSYSLTGSEQAGFTLTVTDK